MCSVCGGSTFRAATWRSSSGSQWPALECLQCGAITREMQLQSRAPRTATIMPPATSSMKTPLPKIPPLPRDTDDVAARFAPLE